jgi:hypothetical protein
MVADRNGFKGEEMSPRALGERGQQVERLWRTGERMTSVQKRLEGVIRVVVHALHVVGCVTFAGAEDPPNPAPSEFGARGVRVFYFGNSLTAASVPALHGELGRRADREWYCEAFLGAGWQSWQHRNELWRAMGRPVGTQTQSAASRGDLTLDEDHVRAATGKPKQFLTGEWDAIVIQIFGNRMRYVTDQMWGTRFDGPVDVGDVAAASDIIRIFLQKNPHGRVFVYTVWPSMPPGRVPADEQLPPWAVAMKRRTGDLRAAEFPDREAFDYERVWSAPYLGDHEKPWTLADYPHWRTRHYTEQVFAAIATNFPDLWATHRLHHLPGGELFSRLNRRMAAGEFPGIRSIKDFYTDVQHVRAGAGSYSLAVLFYVGFFRERPDRLDYRLYNDPARYGHDPYHDFGDVIEITPERANVIHETVWDLLRTHPQANLGLP